jgi:hypothetical protein
MDEQQHGPKGHKWRGKLQPLSATVLPASSSQHITKRN